ncbi:MAG: hypothetical protein K2Z81_22940, partial [Cyanobacteria bacterium]|nr:hypothetical protein [Cyanobacteriota bacterium]
MERFRALDRKNPDNALVEINASLKSDPSKEHLQWFRWYLANRTGKTALVLDLQRRDYERLRTLSLGEFHLFCLLEADNYRALGPMADLLVEDHPGSREARFVRAQCAALGFNDKQALEDVDFLMADRSDAALSGFRAFLVGTKGNVDEAREMFKAQKQSCKEDPYWKVARLDLLCRLNYQFFGDRGCHDELLAALKDLAECHPSKRWLESHRLWRLMLLHTMWKPAYTIVDNDLKRIVRNSPVPELDEYTRDFVRVWSCASDFSKIRALERELTKKYRSWRIYCILGQMEVAFGSQKKAKELLQTSIELNPNQAFSYYLLGSVSTEPGDYLAYMSRALANFPTHPEYSLCRGLALEHKDPAQSLRDYLAAMKIAPLGSYRYLDYYLTLKARLNPKLDELQEIDRLCATIHDGPNVDLYKTKFLVQHQRMSDAELLARECVSKWPDRVGCWVALGDILQKTGRSQEALSIYTMGIAKTGASRLHLERGRVYLALDRLQNATDEAEYLVKEIRSSGTRIDLPGALKLKGDCCMKNEKWDEAIA